MTGLTGLQGRLAPGTVPGLRTPSIVAGRCVNRSAFIPQRRADTGGHQAVLRGGGERGVEVRHPVRPVRHADHHPGGHLLQHQEEGAQPAQNVARTLVKGQQQVPLASCVGAWGLWLLSSPALECGGCCAQSINKGCSQGNGRCDTGASAAGRLSGPWASGLSSSGGAGCRRHPEHRPLSWRQEEGATFQGRFRFKFQKTIVIHGLF